MTSEEIQVAIEKLRDLLNTSQSIEAKKFAYELLELKLLQKDKESLAKVYNLLGNALYNLSDFSNSLEYYTKALDINQEINNKEAIGINYGNLGRVYKDFFSDYFKALEFYSKALQINQEIGNKQGISRHYTNIGIVYLELSDFNKALEYFSKALLIDEEIENKEGIGSNLVNIGIVCYNINEDEKALEYFKNSLVFLEEIGHKNFYSNALMNIGNAYSKLSDYKKSLEYHTYSLQIKEEIGNKAGISQNLTNIGSVYGKLCNYSKAFEYLNKSLEISLEIGAQKITAINYFNMGYNYNIQESLFYNPVKSEEYLQKALKIAEEINAKDLVIHVYDTLYTLRLNQERYKEALELQNKSIVLEKEIQSTEVKKQADRFDIARKTAEREKQLAVERARYEGRESILRNILPDSVTDRLVKGENPIADHIDSASVLFMDLVGFTSLASIAPPKQLVYLLDAIFHKADEVVETFGLEKIKTIGDGYLAVANVTTPLEEHQKATALAALKLLETMKDFTVNIPNNLGDTEWLNDMKDLEIRIGIHTGEVVAGIIGKNKYTYDLWGDAVNVASRMESNSEAGRIHISEEFAISIEKYPEFSIIPRGEISIKGKGAMNTFWLEQVK